MQGEIGRPGAGVRLQQEVGIRVRAFFRLGQFQAGNRHGRVQGEGQRHIGGVGGYGRHGQFLDGQALIEGRSNGAFAILDGHSPLVFRLGGRGQRGRPGAGEFPAVQGDIFPRETGKKGRQLRPGGKGLRVNAEGGLELRQQRQGGLGETNQLQRVRTGNGPGLHGGQMACAASGKGRQGKGRACPERRSEDRG